MKHLTNLLSFGFIVLLISLSTVSCTNETPPNNHITSIKTDTSVTDSSELKTRALKKKIASKAYYYKSLASFANGKATLSLNDLASLEGKEVNLVVLYEANAPWAKVFNSGKFGITGNDILNGLMESYELQIIQQFAIDDANEGIVMEAKTKLDNPVETARELSMVDHVLMVHVKEIPQTQNSMETADTEK